MLCRLLFVLIERDGVLGAWSKLVIQLGVEAVGFGVGSGFVHGVLGFLAVFVIW
ncbi:hypothetical protein Droror1_Dr00027592, partial [Drosera rotundifolia]